MWVFVTFLFAIILISIFAIFYKWRVNVQYKNSRLKIKLGFITVYSSRKKEKGSSWHLKLLDANFSETFKKIKEIKKFFIKERENIAALLKKLEKSLVIKSLALSVKFGFSNAAVTGVANGAIWGLITAAVTFIDKYVKIKDITNIALRPIYAEKVFDAAFEASFKISLFKIYYIAKDAQELYEVYDKAFNKI